MARGSFGVVHFAAARPQNRIVFLRTRHVFPTKGRGIYLAQRTAAHNSTLCLFSPPFDMSPATTAKMDAQRVVLLQRRLADQEKQTKMLIDRLQGRPQRGNSEPNMQPPAGANSTAGLTTHATGAGGLPRRSIRDQKNRLEQALLDSASRAKKKAGESKGHSHHGKDGSDQAATVLSRETSRAPRSERNGGTKSHKGGGSLSSPRTSHGGDGSNAGDGYSKSAALDSIDRQASDMNMSRKKGRSKKDLVAVDEAAKFPLGRTDSGREIDLETGLPKEVKSQGSFSWFYAVGFVVLIAVLVYASVVILQRFN